MTEDTERALRILTLYGRSSTAYMTLWRGNRTFFGAGGTCYIGYRQVGRAALALGDPIGPPEAIAPTITAFASFCRARHWAHAFHAATPQMLPVYRWLGYRALKLGEEAMIALPALTFRGKEWQDVRSAFNRATRAGIDFRLYKGGTLPAPIRDQVFAISDRWLRAKGLPEMGFTLGTVADVDDPHTAIAVALDSDGQVLAFIDWLPMFAARGWALDLMRRAPDAPPGIMEFLIGSSLRAFKEAGDQVASLSAVPLANENRARERSVLQAALGYLYDHGDRFYHFASLFAFKEKFQPHWEGVYLIYQRPIALPRIGQAIVRAYLPGQSPRAIAMMVGAIIARRRRR